MLQYKILPVTSLEQNCTLLWCDKTQHATLIDPGGDVDLLMSAIKQQNLSLKSIWLTHGHLDHMGGSGIIKKNSNVPIIGPHAEDEFLFKAIALQCQMFGFKEVENFLPDTWLDESQILTLGEEKFSVIYTPGHTPGHIVIKHEAQKLLWVGDVIFRGAIGRSDFPRGDHLQLLTSIKEKLFSLDDDFKIFPGHGPLTSIRYEKLHNPFLKNE